jgi:hypothetical protein
MSSKIAVVLLIGLIAGGSLGYVYSHTLYSPQIYELEIELTKNIGELERVQSRVLDLENELSITNTRYTIDMNDLKDQLDTTKTELLKISSELQTSENELRNLRRSHTDLWSDYHSLEQELETWECLRVGNSMTDLYEHIRDDYQPTRARTLSKLRSQKVKFVKKLVNHDLGRDEWPTIEEEYRTSTGLHSYEVALSVLDEALSIAKVNPSFSNTRKIELILDFVVNHISYETEMDERNLAPVETLTLRSGDCDDYSALVAALFEMSGIDCAVASFENNEKIGHFMVLVQLDELYLDRYWYYDDLTDLGLSPGRWIMIEPQSLLEYQGDDEWMTQWKLMMAAEVGD